jgi:hypothetical protein
MPIGRTCHPARHDFLCKTRERKPHRSTLCFFRSHFQSGRQDSNLRPPGPKPGALPACANKGFRESLGLAKYYGDTTLLRLGDTHANKALHLSPKLYQLEKTSHRVYIIESPSQQDVQEKRKEGLALNQALDLADVPNLLFNVKDKQALQRVFEVAVLDVQHTKDRIGSINFHFSMHGSSKGIRLTSDEFLTWRELYDLIKAFNDKIGYAEAHWAPGRKYSFANLHFSVCQGYEAVEMAQYGEESPFTTLLGPTRDVEWSDSLVAFVTYYHLTIHKQYGFKEAVRVMNYASGAHDEIVFKMQIADGLYADRKPALD